MFICIGVVWMFNLGIAFRYPCDYFYAWVWFHITNFLLNHLLTTTSFKESTSKMPITPCVSWLNVFFFLSKNCFRKIFSKVNGFNFVLQKWFSKMIFHETYLFTWNERYFSQNPMEISYLLKMVLQNPWSFSLKDLFSKWP